MKLKPGKPRAPMTLTHREAKLLGCALVCALALAILTVLAPLV